MIGQVLSASFSTLKHSASFSTKASLALLRPVFAAACRVHKQVEAGRMLYKGDAGATRSYAVKRASVVPTETTKSHTVKCASIASADVTKSQAVKCASAVPADGGKCLAFKFTSEALSYATKSQATKDPIVEGKLIGLRIGSVQNMQEPDAEYADEQHAIFLRGLRDRKAQIKGDALLKQKRLTFLLQERLRLPEGSPDSYNTAETPTKSILGATRRSKVRDAQFASSTSRSGFGCFEPLHRLLSSGMPLQGNRYEKSECGI